VTLPPFSRQFFDPAARFTRIGSGPAGGKAAGLLRMRDVVDALQPPPRIEIDIPRFTVLTADVFDDFMRQDGVRAMADSGESDDRIALAFQQASLPVDILGDLRAIVEHVRTPLAVRSSSLLEDALAEPFAGIYATKMLPNNQPDADARFRRLAEAVKFVYASTFFADARSYRRAMNRGDADDGMAVIVQEVVGRRHDHRYYPDVSGVARSFSFYRAAGGRPEDGVVALALGLGRTIVDDGIAWSYSPARPAAPPPVGSVRELADWTQKAFWAVNMGPPPPYDPIRETEYLVHESLAAAEYDGTLRLTASTYDGSRDRLIPGDGVSGARVLNFAPLLVLREWPLNEAVRLLLQACEASAGGPVEIEFAVTLDTMADRAHLGFLQVRPMMVAAATVDVAPEDLAAPETLIASPQVMGNGAISGLHDIVYVRPDRFDARHSARIAGDVAHLNATLAAGHRPYVLIGFGRWGSSDPWLGVQVAWPQISGARAIVEATLPSMHVEMSQGSHFFHNIASHAVPYFSMAGGSARVDWAWLERQPVVTDTGLVRHVRLEQPLVVKVDGRSGRGIVRLQQPACEPVE
jgi:hypothetical protein